MAAPESNAEQPRRIIAATVVVAAVVAAFAVAYVVSDVLFLLFIGIVASTAVEPAIQALQYRRFPRPLAVGVVYAGIVVALAGLIAVGALLLINQVKELAGDIPRAEQEFHNWLEGAGDVLWAKFARRIVEEVSASSVSTQMDQALAAVGQTASYMATAARSILVVVGVVLLAFYWSLQGERTVRWILLLLPSAMRDEGRTTLEQIEEKLGAYLRGQGIVCLVMAVMASIVYSLLGLRYALVLGIIAGFFEILPVLGPIVAAVPPLGVAIFADHGKVVWVLVAATLMQQAEGYLLIPRIMDKSVGVRPLATLLGIAAFGAVFGIPGAILAIPLAAIVQVLLNRYVLAPEAAQRPLSGGRGALSVQRYEVQQLLHDVRLHQTHDAAESPAETPNHLGEAIEAAAIDLDLQLQRMEEATT